MQGHVGPRLTANRSAEPFLLFLFGHAGMEGMKAPGEGRRGPAERGPANDLLIISAP